MTVFIIAVILIVLFAVSSCMLAHYGVHIKRQSFEYALNWQREHYDISFYDPLEKADYTITGFDGYVLPVQLLKNPVPTDKYIIISHGHTDNHYGMLKYAKMYLDFGFNVIIYDLRAHGENKKTICTFSIRESKDLYELIKDTRRRYPGLKVLGLHGESLGGATTIAVLKYAPEVDFVVDDCGFADIISVMQGGLKAMHIPPFMVYPASVCARIMYGYSFKDMRPIDALKNNKVPILFIHGAEDTYILPSHSERMSRETKGYSEVHLIPGAAHAESILTDPESYRKYVEEFLRHGDGSSVWF
ncbi:MAG: alpha/beta hydrolase [Lachnospiraceae bacterium]|nr:alpha/beta hydrolase [Lachnospiraceae bacterium]